MCGILGLINTDFDKRKILEIFSIQFYRGRDAFGFYDGRSTFTTSDLKSFKETLESSSLLFIQNLHAVNSFVPQPFESEMSVFLWNGEIYNWLELKEEYKLNVKNDTELFHKLLDLKGLDILREINGDYAVAYFLKNERKLFLFRDSIGVKSLFYFRNESSLIFSSDRRVLGKEMRELNPREILTYDLENNIVNFSKRGFYSCSDNISNKNFILKNLKSLLYDAVDKRARGLGNIYVLFSGGIDSSLISFILKDLGYDFTCITAGTENSKDVLFAKEVAKYYGFKHEVVYLDRDLVSKKIDFIKELINSDNYVKLSVALPFYFALESVKNKSKVVFSGLGSEEIFAGYKRFEGLSLEVINKECVNGLLILHERDLYRDDVISMWNGFELRLPFLDKNLIEFALHIKGDLKIKGSNRKIILTEFAKMIGYKDEFAERKKLAAQYGSGVDKILEKIAKERGIRKREL